MVLSRTARDNTAGFGRTDVLQSIRTMGVASFGPRISFEKFRTGENHQEIPRTNPQIAAGTLSRRRRPEQFRHMDQGQRILAPALLVDRQLVAEWMLVLAQAVLTQ
jgi:hypothetical protein